MKDLLYEYLQTNQTSVTIGEAVQTLFLSLVLAILIFIVYKVTYSGVMYSRRFNVSLLMITLITTMIMIVIGSNIAMSLGMVGALSIVRFRTAIKDPRDTAYLFWGVGVGLCVGAHYYTIAIVGTLFIGVVLVGLSLGGVKYEDKFLLIIRGQKGIEAQVRKEVFERFKASKLRSQTVTKENVELIYQLRLKKADDKGLVGALTAINEVESVNMIAQSGETIG